MAPPFTCLYSCFCVTNDEVWLMSTSQVICLPCFPVLYLQWMFLVGINMWYKNLQHSVHSHLSTPALLISYFSVFFLPVPTSCQGHWPVCRNPRIYSQSCHFSFHIEQMALSTTKVVLGLALTQQLKRGFRMRGVVSGLVGCGNLFGIFLRKGSQIFLMAPSGINTRYICTKANWISFLAAALGPTVLIIQKGVFRVGTIMNVTHQHDLHHTMRYILIITTIHWGSSMSQATGQVLCPIHSLCYYTSSSWLPYGVGGFTIIFISQVRNGSSKKWSNFNTQVSPTPCSSIQLFRPPIESLQNNYVA